MLKNYFKIAWRNLGRNKVYSAINITGLAIGLAVCMLIVLYTAHESSYDKFHENSKRIYWVQAKIKLGNDSLFMPYLNYSAGPSIKQNEPSVEKFLRVKREERNTIIQNPKTASLKFAEGKFFFADSNFFNFFSFKLLRGNKDQVLQNPFSVVISQNAAHKYFGKQDPIGNVIRYNNAYDLIVTGVAEKAPSNSTIAYDFVASLSTLPGIVGEKDLIKNEENAFSTYFLLKQPADISRIEAGLSILLKARDNNGQVTSRYIGIPLANIHLSVNADTTNTKYLKIFPIVAALILLLALFNYISLSTARSTIRAKEIGVRKAMGASRIIIAIQFFTESALYTAIAFVLGYILCLLFQPFFFNFLQIDIDSSFLYYPYVLLSFTGLFVITVVLAATYPSLLLSAYKPVAVLYGKLRKQGGSITVRKFITVFQFTIAVIFIICGIIIEKQIYFFKHADTGVNRQNVAMIPFAPSVGKHFTAFKKDIQSLPAIQQFSIALHPMYKGYDMMGVKPRNSDQMILLPMLSVDQNFISLLGLKWNAAPADSLYYLDKNTAILNETAVNKLNLGSTPLNQKVDEQFEVAGVLKDFNWSSLQHKIDGLCLFITRDDDNASLWAKNGGYVFVKTNPNINISAFINQMKTLHEKYDRENPFEYYFMDDAFDAMYKAEDRLSKILMVFTAFTVIVACLGLFGLVTFMAAQRTKEIGIRKVLGASVQNVVTLLSMNFVKLVVIAVVIATPVAWWFMNAWLQDFAYRVSMEWWVFLSAGFISVLIAMLTISFQAIKAAIANPVKSLRTE